MANGQYLEGVQQAYTGGVVIGTDTIKAALINTASYTVSLTGHRFLSDVTGAAIEETTTLPNCYITTAGAFDGDDIVFSGTSGSSCEAIIIYKDTGTDSTSPLLFYIDTVDSGLPVTLGGAVTIVWDNGANRIFKWSSGSAADDTRMVFTATKTANYTAAEGEIVQYDASGGTFTIYAPASPTAGDEFGVKNVHATDTTSVTIDGNGDNIEPANGGTLASSVTIANANGCRVWKSDGTQWYMILGGS